MKTISKTSSVQKRVFMTPLDYIAGFTDNYLKQAQFNTVVYQIKRNGLSEI
jgi:hypothetical protein